jgi:hypothetical protein
MIAIRKSLVPEDDSRLMSWRFCQAPDGSDVEVRLEAAGSSEEDHPDGDGGESTAEGENCHYHAGVKSVFVQWPL